MLEIIPAPPLPPRSPDSWSNYRDHNYHISSRFQWLPTDFQVSQDAKSAKSLGYINNLNPDEHAELHKTIEGLVGLYIPLFERALTDSIYENGAVRGRVHGSYDSIDPDSPEPNYNDFEVLDEYHKACAEWDERRIIVAPDIVHEYVPGSLEKREVWYGLAGKAIQVIVKLANIYLVSFETWLYEI